MNYYVVFGAPFLLLLLPLSAMFGSYIGHLNHALWKSGSEQPKIELKGLWRVLIPMIGHRDWAIYENKKTVYKITFKLMLAFYIITAIIILLVIAGFIIVAYFDYLGLLFTILCGTICGVSYLLLFFIIYSLL
ncbi:MAG: hypothetical protein K2J01_02155 [Clostridiales bacterium]|nr:hypothetical protein [Clostridiales bacterium]